MPNGDLKAKDGEGKRAYTVSQVNSYVKKMLDGDFLLKNICVRGEVSNCKYHGSGHVYFSLKDDSGSLSCVMFANYAIKQTFRLEDGMNVLAQGSVTAYERDGRVQLYAKKLEEDGKGDLFRQFEELKKRLEEMGMFSSQYKKPVPPFCMNIGVVTSKTGAVIRDIQNVAKRRNPYCKITLYPARVQGSGADIEIARGLEALDGLGLDCIIIARGGGSMEDLWCFNSELLARAIFNANTPVISAVGHETDFTISDFAADLRAPTPSAAAELCVFDYEGYIRGLSETKSRLYSLMTAKLGAESARLDGLKRVLSMLSPEIVIMQKKQYLQDLENALYGGVNLKLQNSKAGLLYLSGRLDALSPLKRLESGYAYISAADGSPVKSALSLKRGDLFSVTLADGLIKAEAREVEKIRDSSLRSE